jgi:NADPH2:quinone reductase
MTAHRCVFSDGSVEGQTVLVTGGAGRVGHYAIQWAKQGGAKVIATASNDEDATACGEAGAMAVVNHRDPGWGQSAVRANSGKKLDRVVDVQFGANLGQVLELVRTGGTIAAYASTQEPEPTIPFYRMMYLDLTVHTVIVYEMPEAAKFEAIADLDRYLREGRLIHRVTHTLPLDGIARAHDLVEKGGTRGCVVVNTE